MSRREGEAAARGPDARALRRLERRDRGALLIHLASGAVVVLAGETAAFHYGLAERFGVLPLLARGALYLALSAWLWAALLRAGRRMVVGLMEERRQGYESILSAYDGAVALKDAYTGGHGRRVARYARVIAAAMGLPEDEADAIAEAALLHDIGKIGVPDRILAKPAPLTPEEDVLMRRHPAAGADILASIPPLRRHAAAVRHHHERFDGGGYPGGLRGPDIPLAARVIAVADVFDALTSDRSYRRAVPPPDALEELARGSGGHFDPRIVALLAQGPVRDALLAARSLWSERA